MYVYTTYVYLQDPRIAQCLADLINVTKEQGVQQFACNGTCENDWPKVRAAMPMFCKVHDSVPWTDAVLLDRWHSWQTSMQSYNPILAYTHGMAVWLSPLVTCCFHAPSGLAT